MKIKSVKKKVWVPLNEPIMDSLHYSVWNSVVEEVEGSIGESVEEVIWSPVFSQLRQINLNK